MRLSVLCAGSRSAVETIWFPCWNGSYQSAHIQRVNRDVGFVAGIDCGGKFGHAVHIQGKSRSEQNEHFATWNRAEILGHRANRKQHGTSAQVRFRIP